MFLQHNGSCSGGFSLEASLDHDLVNRSRFWHRFDVGCVSRGFALRLCSVLRFACVEIGIEVVNLV